MLLWLLACTPNAPVVSGVKPSTTAVITEKRQAQERRATPENIVAEYKKAEGVYIDARYFGGKDYDTVRGQLAEQFGALQDGEDLGDKGRALNFERGKLRVKNDGSIYMIEVPLPDPLRRTEALALLGFPPAAQDYLDFTHEYRLNNAWGFRRILFYKTQVGSEEIERVLIWKVEP